MGEFDEGCKTKFDEGGCKTKFNEGCVRNTEQDQLEDRWSKWDRQVIHFAVPIGGKWRELCLHVRATAFKHKECTGRHVQRSQENSRRKKGCRAAARQICNAKE